jgi:hypothetical protein
VRLLFCFEGRCDVHGRSNRSKYGGIGRVGGFCDQLKQEVVAKEGVTFWATEGEIAPPNGFAIPALDRAKPNPSAGGGLDELERRPDYRRVQALRSPAELLADRPSAGRLCLPGDVVEMRLGSAAPAIAAKELDGCLRGDILYDFLRESHPPGE